MDTRGFSDGAKNLKQGFSNIGATAKKLGAVLAGAFAVGKLIQFGKEAVDLGSDLSEVQNVVDVTFENMSEDVNEFARNAITQFGLSETSAKRYASTMGAMLKSMGFSIGDAKDMSTTLAGLAGDLASFYNLSGDEAFAKIRAGISGETEPLKQLGINLNIANLEQFALTKGIKKSYSAMTQQEQALLRYNYLLSVTADAQGDFSRTSESWANQTRILAEQFNSLKATLGQGLINVLTPVLKILNAIIARLQVVADAFRSLTELWTGKNAASGAAGVTELAESFDNVAESASEAEKAQKQYLSGLDEINTYASDETEIGADIGTLGTIDIGAGIPDIGDADMSKVDGLADKIAEKIAGLIDRLKQSYQDGDFTWVGKELAEKISSGIDSVDWPTELGRAARVIGNAIKGMLDVATGFAEEFDWTGLGYVLENSIVEIVQNIDWNGIVIKLFKGLGSLKGGKFALIWAFCTDLWDDIVGALSQVGDYFNSKIEEMGGDILLGILEGMGDAVIGIGIWIYDHIFKPFIDGFCKVFGIHSPADTMVEPGKNIIFGMFEGIKAAFGNVTRWLSDLPGVFGQYFTWAFTKVRDISLNIVRFFENIFSGRWNDAWQNIKDIFKSVWDGLVDVVKTPINLIIGLINGMISGISQGLNSLIDLLNQFKIDVPDDVPFVGGLNVGFDIPKLSAPQIPYLARGAVIPPNAPFAAVLGDQRRGTNIEAPLDTIKDAVRDVLREGEHGGGTYRFTAQIGRRVLFDEVITEAKMRQSATGRNPFALA